jgi:hypothetical protein
VCSTGPLRILALCLCAVFTGCILYSDPINREPEISGIKVTPSNYETYTRRLPVSFEATVSDDGDRALATTWWVATGLCKSPWPASDRPLPQNQYVPTVLGPHCVRVEVVDQHGAAASATTAFEVTNFAPTAQIAMTTPLPSTAAYPLFSEFVFEPRVSDLDSTAKPKHRWRVIGPDGQQRAIAPCPGPAEMLCFTGETTGEYRITLDATDAENGQASPAEMLLQVAEDAPPCIVDQQPTLLDVVRDPNTALTLSFAVADDGDPLPARSARPSMAAITWRFRRTGRAAFDRLVGAGERFLTLPAGAFIPGDDIELRVDIADRVNRIPTADCTEDSTECALTTKCQQRASWRIRYL